MRGAGEVRHVVVHGHRRAYRMAGSGPALLLLHGLGCDSTTWDRVMAPLAEHFTVVAPDLLGHGESAKPDADYSLGAYANGMRDLLTVLGIDRVTVVGHSLGGGVAMQFAYQYPDRTERVVLLSSGGLGPEVTPLIRFLTLPGSGVALTLATARPWRSAVGAAMRGLSRTGLTAVRDLDEVARIYDNLADPATRRALQRVTGHVVTWRGQLVTMTDRTYLAALVPVLVLWGADDMVIPVSHAQVARDQDWSDVHVLEGCGHFPHRDRPDEVVRLLVEFVQTHEPARFRRGAWRAMLRRGAAPELAPAAAGATDPADATG